MLRAKNAQKIMRFPVHKRTFSFLITSVFKDPPVRLIITEVDCILPILLKNLRIHLSHCCFCTSLSYKAQM